MPNQRSGSEQWIIKNAEANMRIEGFTPTERVKRDCRAMINGSVSADKLVKKYVEKHTKKRSI